MIIDHRLYTLKPEKIEAWLAPWQEVALPLQLEILGEFLGMYRTEVGPNLSELIHLWGYRDMGERERRRLALAEETCGGRNSCKQPGVWRHLSPRVPA